MALYPNAIAAVIICTIFPVLSGISVCIRSYAQREILQRPFRTDDYLIICGQVIALSTCIMGIYGAYKGGLGWPLQDIARFGVEEPLGKMVLASHVLWASSVSVVRIGLLLYYRRLFSTRIFMIANTSVILLSVLWWMTAVLTTTISFTWNSQFQQARFSINFFGWLIAATVMNVFLDIATIVLPVCVIGSLKLSGKKKIMVCGIFTLGILCIVASLVRLYYIAKFYTIKHPTPEDSSSAIFHAFIWATIEPCTSIIAASLPTYAPIIKKLCSKGYFKALNPFSSCRDTHNSVKKSIRVLVPHGGDSENSLQVPGKPDRLGGDGWMKLKDDGEMDVFGIARANGNGIRLGMEDGHEMHILNKPMSIYTR